MVEKFTNWVKTHCQPSASDKEVCSLKTSFQIPDLPKALKSKWRSEFASSYSRIEYIVSEVSLSGSELNVRFFGPSRYWSSEFSGWIDVENQGGCEQVKLRSSLRVEDRRSKIKAQYSEYPLSHGEYESIKEAIVKQWEKSYPFVELKRPLPVKDFAGTSIFAPQSPWKLYAETPQGKMLLGSEESLAGLDEKSRVPVAKWLKVLKEVSSQPNSCVAHARNYLQNTNVLILDPDKCKYSYSDVFSDFRHVGLCMLDYSMGVFTFCHELGHALHRGSVGGHDNFMASFAWWHAHTSHDAAFEEGFADFVGDYRGRTIGNTDWGGHMLETVFWDKARFKAVPWNGRLSNEFFVSSLLHFLATAEEGNYDRVMSAALRAERRRVQTNAGDRPIQDLEDFLQSYIKTYPDQKPLVRKLVENYGLQAGEQLPEWIR